MNKPRVFKALALLWGLLWSLGPGCAWAMAPSSAMRSQSLAFLNELQKQNRTRLEDIDRKLQEALSTAARVRSGDETQRAQDPLAALEKDVQGLLLQRREHLLRQDFLDRLRFQIESKFTGQGLKAFLENTLTRMALAEATTTDSSPEMWKFLTYLNIAIHNLPENEKDVLAFVEGYMKSSSIANPVRPDRFNDSRNYTNGVNSSSGNPTEREDIGEAVEAKLLALEAEKARAEDKKAFEERRPVLKGVTQMIQDKSLIPARIEDWKGARKVTLPAEPGPSPEAR